MDPTRKVRYTCTTSVAKKVKADDDITDVNVTVDHDITNQDEANTILKEVNISVENKIIGLHKFIYFSKLSSSGKIHCKIERYNKYNVWCGLSMKVSRNPPGSPHHFIRIIEKQEFHTLNATILENPYGDFLETFIDGPHVIYFFLFTFLSIKIVEKF